MIIFSPSKIWYNQTFTQLGLLIATVSQMIGPQRWRSGIERWPRKRKIGCLNPSRDRQKS